MKLQALALAAAAAAVADGCGFTVHIAVSHRALDYFAGAGLNTSILTQYRGALEAGSPYPDYLYQCGVNHDDGEYSHWTPFQWAAARWMASHYPQPWNASGYQLATFMTGVVSHYVADINWHGLAETPSSYGLIETIGMLDFNCTGKLASGMACGWPPADGSPAHTMADTGGEFVAAYATALGDDDPNSWIIPMADLLSIYASVNRSDVTASAIEECAVEFYAGAEAIKTLAALVEPLEVAPSPTLAESFLDLPCGGIDDMAVYASRLWQRWWSWLGRGVPPVPPGGEYCPGICEGSGGGGEQGQGSSSREGTTAQEGEAEAGFTMGARERSESQKALKDLYRTLAPALLGQGLVSTNGGSGTSASAGARMLHIQREAGDSAGAVLHYLRQVLTGGCEASAAVSGRWQPKLTAGWTAHQPEDCQPAVVAERLLTALSAAGAEGLIQQLTAQISASAGMQPAPVRVALQLLDRLEGARTAKPSAGGGSGSQAAASSSPLLSPEQKALLDRLSSSAPPAPTAVYASTLPLEYAGQGVAMGDWNGDGVADVTITAYGHTATGPVVPPPAGKDAGLGDGATLLPQAGAVYVRYGGSSTDSTGATTAAGQASPLPSSFPVLLEGALSYTRFGWDACTLDLNADGVDDLAVSAPAWGWDWTSDVWDQAPSYPYVGAVLVFFGRKGTGLGTNTLSPDVLITGVGNNTHTGMHLQCGDVNGDGRADLVVGSHMALVDPSNPVGTTQAGRVDVFLSSTVYGTASTAAAAAGSSPDPTSGASASTLRLSLSASNYSWTGSGPGEWMGYSTAIISDATQAVGVTPAELAALYGLTAADLEAAGVEEGSAGAANVSLLLVGQPGYRVAQAGGAGPATVGRVSAFVIPHQSQPGSRSPMPTALSVSPAPLFSITADPWLTKGQYISAKLGHGVGAGYPTGQAGGPWVAIGMTAVDWCNSSALLPNASMTGVYNTSAGSVTLVRLTPALRGDVAWSDVTGPALGPALNTTVLASSLPEARYGWHVGFADVDGDGAEELLVGAPMYTPVFIGTGTRGKKGTTRTAAAGGGVRAGGDSGHEAGLLAIYRGSTVPGAFPFPGAPVGAGPGVSSMPSRPVTCAAAAEAWALIPGQQQFSRVGSAWLLADVDGDGSTELLVAGPRAAEASSATPAPPEMPGAVYAFNATTLAWGW